MTCEFDLYMFVKNGKGDSAIISHLSSCEACRTIVAEIELLRMKLAMLPTVRAPAGFRTRVMAKIQELMKLQRMTTKRTVKCDFDLYAFVKAGKKNAQVAAHLESCDTCKIAVEAIERIRGGIILPAAVSASPDFSKKVVEKICEHIRKEGMITDAVFGQLPAGTKNVVLAHCKTCETCMSEIGEISMVKQALDDMKVRPSTQFIRSFKEKCIKFGLTSRKVVSAHFNVILAMVVQRLLPVASSVAVHLLIFSILAGIIFFRGSADESKIIEIYPSSEESGNEFQYVDAKLTSSTTGRGITNYVIEPEQDEPDPEDIASNPLPRTSLILTRKKPEYEINETTIIGRGFGDVMAPGSPDLVIMKPEEASSKRQFSFHEESKLDQMLMYLKNAQEPDGSWIPSKFGAQKDDFKLATTALALLSFVGDGYSHLRGKYSDVIARGLNFILTHQSTVTGEITMAGEKNRIYGHSISTLFLLRLYSISNDTSLKVNVGSALRFLVASQNATGGWCYLGTDFDTSVTSWVAQCLRISTGLDLKSANTKGALGRCAGGITRLIHEDGKVRYQGKTDNPFPQGYYTTTSMGAVIYLMANKFHETYRMNQFAKIISERGPSLAGRQYLQNDLCFSYYASLYYALTAPESAAAKKFFNNLRDDIFKLQEKDGGMPANMDKWGGYGGRIYTTAMSLLCLEAPYLYKPIAFTNR